MARERMVTRTILEAEVICLCVNTLTREVCDIKFKISAYIPKDKVVEYLQKTENGDLRPVSIIDYKVNEILYGMPENDFIKYAKILPPRSAQVEAESEA